ncbi:glucuronate isomerase [Paraburkholderia oxyphila]|uniref:glucuronate isomerase n=1 Tax=Paraburkholderia oxyphila TaxID=614212 RepID=UPI00048A2F7A|nr:glucuronate isomerase [Paraburkholderia oxyphila]
MNPFMGDNFLLSSDCARKLYHEYARPEPIFDYHCHLSVKEIADDRRFNNITEIWLKGDHYKWRAMRALGNDERYITGDASDREKFDVWADDLPSCLGNPLYHWSHLELRAGFGIDDPISGGTADRIWNETSRQLRQPGMSARGLLRKFNVRLVGSTDDPTDTLEFHAQIARDPSMDDIAVRPNWRADNLVKIEADGFAAYIDKLARASETAIGDFQSLKVALLRRLDHFCAHGCIAADHGIPVLRFAPLASGSALDQIVQKRLSGQRLSEEDIAQYATAIQVWLAGQYAERGWAMQLHIGAQLNNNTAMLNQIGPNAGFDAIRDRPISEALAGLLDAMNSNSGLPKLVIHTINPSQNEVVATLCACFQGGNTRGKIQFGAAWWFNDQLDGMRRQLTQLSQLGILGTFVGMITDSRSLLSYSRHEYFRRLLCDMVGTWMENGEVPQDYGLVGEMIRKICYRNAAEFFSV